MVGNVGYRDISWRHPVSLNRRHLHYAWEGQRGALNIQRSLGISISKGQVVTLAFRISPPKLVRPTLVQCCLLLRLQGASPRGSQPQASQATMGTDHDYVKGILSKSWALHEFNFSFASVHGYFNIGSSVQSSSGPLCWPERSCKSFKKSFISKDAKTMPGHGRYFTSIYFFKKQPKPWKGSLRKLLP